MRLTVFRTRNSFEPRWIPQGTGGAFYCRLPCRRFDPYPSFMGPNRRAQERERAAAEAAAKAKRAETERKAIADAKQVVEIWNARQAGGRELWFYPTIGAKPGSRG